VKNDGSLSSWGQLTFGQLGNNFDGNVYSPTQVGTLATWGALATGVTSSLAFLVVSAIVAATVERLKQNNKGKPGGTIMGPGIF
jgi:hypothetical protein